MKNALCMKQASLIFFISSFTVLGGDWPQWLGPTRDNHVAAKENLPIRLYADLKPIWKIPIGGGFSSPIVADERLVYFDENGEKEIVHSLDAKTGKEIWQTPIASRYADEWGAGPRSTPFVDEDRVYVQSCNGEFRCLNLADGKIVWGASFEKDFGVKFLGSKANEGVAARRWKQWFGNHRWKRRDRSSRQHEWSNAGCFRQVHRKSFVEIRPRRNRLFLIASRDV